MNKTKEIDLAAARADMVLARAAVNSAGRTLARAGTVLTDNLIEGLCALGIKRLAVSLPEDATADAAAQAERIEYLFRKAAGDPIRAALRRALEQYRRGGKGEC